MRGGGECVGGGVSAWARTRRRQAGRGGEAGRAQTEAGDRVLCWTEAASVHVLTRHLLRPQDGAKARVLDLGPVRAPRPSAEVKAFSLCTCKPPPRRPWNSRIGALLCTNPPGIEVQPRCHPGSLWMVLYSPPSLCTPRQQVSLEGGWDLGGPGRGK